MNEAISIFYSIYSQFFTTIFEHLFIVDGVSIGWVFVVIFIFTGLIRSLLALPRSAPRESMHGLAMHRPKEYYRRRISSYKYFSR